jgi:predicted thioesterase
VVAGAGVAVGGICVGDAVAVSVRVAVAVGDAVAVAVLVEVAVGVAVGDKLQAIPSATTKANTSEIRFILSFSARQEGH